MVRSAECETRTAENAQTFGADAPRRNQYVIGRWKKEMLDGEEVEISEIEGIERKGKEQVEKLYCWCLYSSVSFLCFLKGLTLYFPNFVYNFSNRSVFCSFFSSDLYLLRSGGILAWFEQMLQLQN